MTEKDTTEKTLESYNDVFADIVNVIIFDGEQVVKEEDLEDATPYSMYKSDNGIHELERDCAKYWIQDSVSENKPKIRIAFVGFENQTIQDAKMPIRVIGYDGASYRAQLNDSDNEIYPVVTLVLYFGDKKWTKPKSLLNCFRKDKRLNKFVSDYKINIVEVSFLKPETVTKFKSDFRIIADYFVQSRFGKYHPSKDEMKHIDEVMKTMSVLTNDNRFDETYNKMLKRDGYIKGGHNMCTILSDMINESVAKGIAEGMEQGVEKGSYEKSVEVVNNMLSLNMDDEIICKISGLNIDEVLEIKKRKKFFM